MNFKMFMANCNVFKSLKSFICNFLIDQDAFTMGKRILFLMMRLPMVNASSKTIWVRLKEP